MRFGDGPTLLLELVHRCQRHSGIGSLMAAQQGHLQVGQMPFTRVKLHAIAVTGTHLDVPLEVPPGQQQGGVLLLTTPREDFNDLRSLWGTYHATMRLDDASLFARNSRQGIP